jgi:thymidylate synthase
MEHFLSVDSFLGKPFNIASTSLLLYIIAKLTNTIPNKVHFTLGDCHIYQSHIEQVKTQLTRMPLDFPQLKIPDFKSLQEVENSKLEDYVIENYQSHPSIKAEMVA